MFKRTKVCQGVMLALGGAAAVSGAWAQQAQPQSLERVEVTGSRLRTIDTETAQPVLKLTHEDIVKSGLVTAGDIVNSLVSTGTPAFTKGSVLTSNREQGGQYADMRNLGAQRVLVLVNGKRWATTINGYTDMSNIPSSLIDRVEVLKDGASSIYGSDAIAGVVNFILKRNFEGGEANVYYGSNEKGDGTSKQFDLTYGTGNDKGSLIANFSYSSTGTVWANKRDATATSYGPQDDRFSAGFGASPWGRIRYVNPANGQATGPNLMLNHTGSYLGDGVGADSRNPANYHAYAGATADKFNSTSQMMFEAPTELKSLFLKGDYDLSSAVRFKFVTMYSERTGDAQVAGYPLNSMTQFTHPVYVDKDSYYNPYGNSVAGAGNGRDLFFYRRTIEVPRVVSSNLKTLHVDAGLEGDFKVSDKEWHWDAGVNYNNQDGTFHGTGNLNLINLKQALGPSFMNAQGQVQCGTAAAPIAFTQCVPFNILGGPSASTGQALDYVMAKTTATTGSTITSYTANVTGALAKLPAGELALAVGAEYRRVSGYDHPDQLASMGYTTDLAAQPTDGAYDVKELYAELGVPILKGLPGADLLSLDLATRYSKYSNFGSTTNSKVSFMYKPVADLMFRGTWAEGFRAPTLGDISGGGQQSFDTYLDPCDSRYGEAAHNPAVAARCAAAGVPANFRQVNQAGSPVSVATQGVTAFNAGAGNADLKPETATTKTVGFVYNPAQLAGFSVAVDWWRIEVKNSITAVSATYVMNQCYITNNPAFCSSITRDPISGMINGLSRGNLNAGAMLTEGYDFNVTYQLPRSSWGDFRATLDATYLTKYKTKGSPDADYDDYTGEFPTYRMRANLALDWKRGDWSARFGTRYYGSFKDTCWDSTPDAPVDCSNPDMTSASWGTGVNKKHALVYNDINVGYKLPWKGEISFGINNVFGVKAAMIYWAGGQGTGSSSSSSVDPSLPIDRFYYMRYSQRF